MFACAADESRVCAFSELKEDAPEVGGCCGPKYKVATQVVINKAVGLKKAKEKSKLYQ